MVSPSRGPQSPVVAVVIAVGALLLAAGSVVIGLRETRLTCTPAACVIARTYPTTRREHALADMRAVEIGQGSGKQRSTWWVALIDVRGASFRVHSTGQAEAEALKRELEQLLAGEREAVERVTPPIYGMFAFAALLLAFGIYEIRAVIRNRGRYARPASPATRGSMRRPLLLWLGLAIGALAVATIANLALSSAMSDSTGVLQLECRYRCEFSGATCLPGGVMEQGLNPGEYEVKVWNPAVAGSWEPRKVQVEVGQVTRFVCEPGG